MRRYVVLSVGYIAVGSSIDYSLTNNVAVVRWFKPTLRVQILVFCMVHGFGL